MTFLTIHMTRLSRLSQPEPLPEITETPRQAFFAGWWGGICIGSVIGSCLMYALLTAIGRIN